MLIASLVLSIVLTVVLNLAIRAFPGATERGARRLDGWAQRAPESGRRVHVYFPWKAMLLGSIALTILLNLLVR